MQQRGVKERRSGANALQQGDGTVLNGNDKPSIAMGRHPNAMSKC